MAPLSSAPRRLASLRSAPLRSARRRSARLKSACAKFASRRSESLSLASRRSAPRRSAPLRVVFRRSASLRLAPRRSAPKRSGRTSGAAPLHRFQVPTPFFNPARCSSLAMEKRYTDQGLERTFVKTTTWRSPRKLLIQCSPFPTSNFPRTQKVLPPPRATIDK